jgi:hypothetical protein
MEGLYSRLLSRCNSCCCMSSIGSSLRRLTSTQLTGIAAQFMFAAPSLAASFVLARWSNVKLVGDLSVAFGVTSAITTAASFNLTQALALWGFRDFSELDYWANRVYWSIIAALIAALAAYVLHLNGLIALTAILVKFTDGGADLRLGLGIVHHGPAIAMQHFLRWSAARFAVLSIVTAVAITAGIEGATALLLGAAAQFILMQAWRETRAITVSRQTIRASAGLARRYVFLSTSAASSGLLVTSPRLAAKYVLPPADLGFYGIAFMATTFVGMSFNLVWYNVAATNRVAGTAAAWREFFRTGWWLAILLALGLWFTTPLVAVIYGITDPRFTTIFRGAGLAFVVFYFVMCITNLLKTSAMRPLETSAYLTACALLFGITVLTQSVNLGILGGAAVLATFVFLGMRNATGRV